MSPVIELSVTEKLSQLGMEPDQSRWATLYDWAQLTALKHSQGQFSLGHWWRGPLLYSLVQHYKPRHILEFGTGRGYGAICMVQASLDAGFECRLWTIDKIPPDQPQEWPIDEGNKPEIKQLSLKQVWNQCLPKKLIDSIHCLTGDSRSVMKRWKQSGLPHIDFCFIDGEHDYWGVKHDLVSTLQIANPNCSFLFDDYTERKGYGVRRLVDKEIAPQLSTEALEIISTLSRDKTVFGEDVEHKMAFIRGEFIDSIVLNQLYSSMIRRYFHLRDAIHSAGTGFILELRELRNRVLRRQGGR